jgi:hypothetical protein
MSLHRDYRMIAADIGHHGIVADNKGYDVNDKSAGVRLHQQVDKGWADPFTNLQRARLWIADHTRAAKAAGVKP